MNSDTLIEAKVANIRTLSNESKLIIPFFQRKYVWTEENWKELLNSFMKEEVGFIGSIIAQRNKNSVGSPEIDIIDGQQRLTTINIFLVALYDSIKTSEKTKWEEDLYRILFTKDNETGDLRQKLEHSQKDRGCYIKIVNENIEIRKKEKGNSGIIGCYNFFLSSLNEEEYNDKYKFDKFKSLVNYTDGRNYFVLITLDKNVDEQSIFDTLNSAGVPLTSADTIKNALFKKASDLYKQEFNGTWDSKLNNLYKENWENIFIDDDSDIYWDSTIITGRIKRSNLEMFLYCFAIIKNMYNAYENTISDLSRVFKDKLNNIDSCDEIDQFLHDIKKYARVYRDRFDFNFNNILYKYEVTLEGVLLRLIHLLNQLENSTMYPYILKILVCEVRNDFEKRDQLHKLEKYIIFNHLNKDTTRIKNYNKMVLTFLNDDKKIDKELEMIGDNYGFSLLKNISNKMATFYLFWVELFKRNSKLHDTNELKYAYSLEHIMPKKWEKNWGNLPKFDGFGNPLSEIDAIKFRNDHIQEIGNMTLLKKTLNTSISNASFNNKIEKLKEYTDLTITKIDIVDLYEKNGQKEWNEEVIENRSEGIKKVIIKAFLY